MDAYTEANDWGKQVAVKLIQMVVSATTDEDKLAIIDGFMDALEEEVDNV